MSATAKSLLCDIFMHLNHKLRESRRHITSNVRPSRASATAFPTTKRLQPASRLLRNQEELTKNMMLITSAKAERFETDRWIKLRLLRKDQLPFLAS